jgi:predicted transcriptional regulator
MTKAEIEGVFERVRTWPEERQRDAAAVLLQLEAEGTDVYVLSEEEREAIDEGIAEADRGEFATAEEVEAVLGRFRAR